MQLALRVRLVQEEALVRVVLRGLLAQGEVLGLRDRLDLPVRPDRQVQRGLIRP